MHKPSKTLIITDAVVSVPPTAPQIVRSANLMEAGGPLPGLIRALSSLDVKATFREKLLNSKLEQPVESQSAQLLLGRL